MNGDLQFQIAKLLLSDLGSYGFVLSGGRALIELGITARPTQDLDFFTNEWNDDRFEEAVMLAVRVLLKAGHEVEIIRQQKSFAQLKVVYDEQSIEIDLGYDFREDPPVTLSVGPVLSMRDAILNKVSALYSRSLTRDFIDLYNIRISSKFSDDQLLSLSQVRDEGFLLPYFIESLRRVETLSYENFSEYGITREQYSKIKRSALEWADTIEASQKV